jgi:S1-C subfamily serine protease
MRRPTLTAGLMALLASCSASSSPVSGDRALMASAVQIVADGCVSVDIHGAGLVVAPGRIATVAHVVAGATSVTVRNGRGQLVEATVAYFDPVNDVAVLAVDETFAPAVPLGSATAGATGTAIVYRDDKPVALAVSIRRLVDIETADIYGDGDRARPGFELGVDIVAGDSGSVVVVDGHAVGLVWSRSRKADGRAWAMRTSLIADHLSSAEPVDHGHCL